MTRENLNDLLPPPPSRWPMFMSLAAAILIFGVAIALIVNSRLDTTSLRTQLRSTQEDLALAKATLVANEMTMQAARSKLAPLTDVLAATRLQLVELSPPDASGKARGRILWDKDRGAWLVAAFDLAPLADGRVYALWLVGPDGKKIQSKTFAPSVNSEAIVAVELPKDVPLTGAIVTDEPASGSSEPSGATHLAAAID